MITPELRQFVVQAMAAGQSADDIRQSLRSQGWESLDIEQAMAQAGQAPVAPKPIGSFPTGFRMLVEAWKHYRARLSTLLVLAAIAGVAMAISQWLSFGRLATEELWNSKNAAATFPGGIAAQIGNVVVMLVYVYAVYAAMVATVRRDVVTAAAALAELPRKVLPLLWISILTGIITFGGFVLLIIPGLIFAIWFSLASYVYLADGARGLNALRLSKEYVRGFYWRMWWFYLVAGVTVALAYLLVNGIFGAIGLVGGPVGGLAVAVALFLTSAASMFVVSYGYQVFLAIQGRKGVLTEAPRATGPIVAGIIGCVILVPLIIIGALLASLSLRPAAGTGGLFDAAAQTEIRRGFEFAALTAGVEGYFTENGSYPSSLEELNANLNRENPIDLSAFRYTSTGASYRLCTTLAGKESCESSSTSTAPVAGQ